jgi:COP9 signalosome complex subunit 3
MHSPFLRLCVDAKCYRDAVAICDIDLIEFPSVHGKGERTAAPSDPPKKDVTYQDVLSYFLYAGMIYLGIKDWRRAMDYLTYVCLLPLSLFLYFC